MPAPLPLATRLQLHKYPRLGVQLQTYTVGYSYPGDLYKFDALRYADLAILDAELTRNNPTYLGVDGVLRTLNPQIVMCSYFSLYDIHPAPDPVWAPLTKLYGTGLLPSWSLKMTNGQPLKLFDFGSVGWSTVLNITVPAARTNWINHMQTNVCSKQGFDGIFVDWGACPYISWLANQPQNAGGGLIDYNNDGVGDTAAAVDSAWRTALLAFHNEARAAISTKFIMGNCGGGVDDSLLGRVNGVLLEGVFRDDQWTSPTAYGSWANQMATYLSYSTGAYFPRASLMLKTVEPDGSRTRPADAEAYKQARFALASACCGPGYFACQNPDHYLDWLWLDEYAVDEYGRACAPERGRGWLGVPTSKATAADESGLDLAWAVKNAPASAEAHPWGVLFTNGAVVLNPMSTPYTLGPLPPEFTAGMRKIQGVYDPTGVNDGQPLPETIVLEPRSALFIQAASPWGQAMLLREPQRAMAMLSAK